MKKLLAILLILSGIALSIIVFKPQKSVQISSLDFDNIVSTFYENKTADVQLNEGEIKDEYIGLREKYNDNNGNTFNMIATLYSIIKYKNISNEYRYLAIIEKRKIYNGYIETCHACSATADLYIFKKLKNDKFELVSKTNKSIDFPSMFGEIRTTQEDLLKGIQPIGKNLMASIFEFYYSNQGYTEVSRYVLTLPEHNYINLYYLGLSEEGNGGNFTDEDDTSLMYHYKSTVSTINNGKKYYPIQVTYKGTNIENNDQMSESKIIPYNGVNILNFSPRKRQYDGIGDIKSGSIMEKLHNFCLKHFGEDKCSIVK